jgi:hypothetical protein
MVSSKTFPTMSAFVTLIVTTLPFLSQRLSSTVIFTWPLLRVEKDRDGQPRPRQLTFTVAPEGTALTTSDVIRVPRARALKL